MGSDAAADARGEPAENEGQCLVAVQRKTIGARRNVVIANRAKAATEMRTEQPDLHQREQNQRSLPGEDSYERRTSSPASQRKPARRTRAVVAKAALWALRQVRQWQWPMGPERDSAS